MDYIIYGMLIGFFILLSELFNLFGATLKIWDYVLFEILLIFCDWSHRICFVDFVRQNEMGPNWWKCQDTLVINLEDNDMCMDSHLSFSVRFYDETCCYSIWLLFVCMRRRKHIEIVIEFEHEESVLSLVPTSSPSPPLLVNAWVR